MAKIYFILTGTKHYFGSQFLEPGMKIELEKEPDNDYDKEAILIKLEGLGKIGYVASSPYTVLGDSMSAGRLYDKIGDKAPGKVVIVTPQGIICRLRNKSLLSRKETEKNVPPSADRNEENREARLPASPEDPDTEKERNNKCSSCTIFSLPVLY